MDPEINTPSPTGPTITQDKKSKLLTILLFGTVFILFFGIGFGIYSYLVQKTQLISNLIIPSPKLKPTSFISLTPSPNLPEYDLTSIVAEILADPLTFKDQEIVVVGCLTSLRELVGFPQLSKSHWVIKDAGGDIPVLGWPKSSLDSKSNLTGDCQQILRLSGTVAIFDQTDKPYIILGKIEELQTEAIFAKEGIKFPQDCSNSKQIRQGVIRRCTQDDHGFTYDDPQYCQKFLYLLELDHGISHFNYTNFENLERVLGKKLFLVGCIPRAMNIMTGPVMYVSEIIIEKSPNISPSFLEPTDSTQTETSCKQAGESICINPLICPNNNDKCCKGLFAVIETKSNVTCQIPSDLNSTKPRLTNLEQLINNNFPKYGHSPDFSWVSGKLAYNSLEGGCWTLHFEEDKQTQTEEYNGVLALEMPNNLRTQLKDREFVVVYGKIIGRNFSMACPQNIYEVSNISSN